jgi:hypothetical protein
MIKIEQFTITKLLILAVFIRVLLMPFFYHPDIKTYNFQSSFLGQGVFNIYSYLIENRTILPLKEEFVYFPLTYYFLGSYQVVISPLLGEDFRNFLFDASAQSLERVGVFRYLFLLKLPYLIFDVLTGFVLMSFFRDRSLRKKAFIFWLFNPFSLYIIYIYSNIDILPVFFSSLSLLLLGKIDLENDDTLLLNRIIKSGLLLAIASGFKAYSFIFLPFILLYIKNWRKRLVYLSSSLGLFLLIILPFLPSADFRASTLVSGLTTRIINPGISLNFGESILIAVLFLGILFFVNFSKPKISFENLIFSLFISLLIVFSFIHFHIQWILWILPFVTLILVKHTNKTNLLAVLLVLLLSIPFLYEDKSMTIGIFSSISTYFDLLPIPFAIVRKVYDTYSLQSVLHTLFAAGMLFFFYKAMKEEKI